MATATCSATGKEMLTRRQAMNRACWFKRAKFARMVHFKCSKCGRWHVGNDSRKYQGRRA